MPRTHLPPAPPDPLARAEARYAMYARMMERAGLLASHYLHKVRRLRDEDARERRRELREARRVGIVIEEREMSQDGRT